MTARFFAGPLETVAHYWRIFRRDGVTLGFVTHDRDLVFGGLRHRATPGFVPSAIRLTDTGEEDSVTFDGALTVDAIRDEDLASGRYDGAEVEIGLVDWSSLAVQALYFGSITEVSREGARFSAEITSRKADLARDPIPRTGPACRAAFCGPGCDLNPRRFEHRARIVAFDESRSVVTLSTPAGKGHEFGLLRFLEGPQAGDSLRILAVALDTVVLDRPLAERVAAGCRVMLREGCDHTIATCSGRFGNAANFRGEPHLPGTDLLAQYPVSR